MSKARDVVLSLKKRFKILSNLTTSYVFLIVHAGVVACVILLRRGGGVSRNPCQKLPCNGPRMAWLFDKLIVSVFIS